MQSFARQTDREESPIFVGREQEIAHIVAQADDVGEAHAQGRATQGRTMVITGCPGSGKSAFLGHFARKFANLDLVETVLIPVPCNHQDLTATDSRELEAQIGALALEKKGGLDKTLQALASDLGTKLKMEKTLGQLEARVAEGSGKRTVVCLLVDEIQNVTGASAAAMQLLHTHAFSPPVLPVYAGLDDSAEQLERVCGISRLGTNAQMTMGALRENSAREATQLLFEKYRVRSTGKAQTAWKEAIEKEALAFGQHLHIALQAACTVLAAAGGEAHAQDATEVKQARTRGQRALLRVEDDRRRGRARGRGARRGAQGDACENKSDERTPDEVGERRDGGTQRAHARVQRRRSTRARRTAAAPGDHPAIGARAR